MLFVYSEKMTLNAATIRLVNAIGLECAPLRRPASRLEIDDDTREIIAASDVFKGAGESLEAFGNTLFYVVDSANNGLLHFRNFGLSYRELSNIYSLAVELQPTLRKKSPFRLMKQGDFFDIEAAGNAIAKKAGHLLGDADDESGRSIVNALYGIDFRIGFVRKLREIYRKMTERTELIDITYRNAPMDFEADYLFECSIMAEAMADATVICQALKQTIDYDPSHIIGEYKTHMGRLICRTDVGNKYAAYKAFKDAGKATKRKGIYIFNRDFATYIGLDKNIANDYALMGSAKRVADAYKEKGVDISERSVRRIAAEVLGSEYHRIAFSRNPSKRLERAA